MTRGPLLRPEPAGAEFVTLLTPPDWSRVFGGPGPLELEIGSGAGALALGHAARYPEVHYVAIEWRKKYARELEHRARAQGLSNPQIGTRIFASESTVKTHVGAILRKLGLRDRVQIVVFAHEHGLVG